MSRDKNRFDVHFLTQLQIDIEYITQDVNRKVQSERALYYPKTNLETYGKSQFSPPMVGDLRLERILSDLKKSMQPFTRFRFQELLHREGLRSVLDCIINDEEERRIIMSRVLETYGWGSQVRNMLLVAGRRSGKSTGLASLDAILLWNCPGIDILVFSVSQTGADEFIGLVYEYLRNIAGKSNRIKGSVNVIRVLHSDGSVSRIRGRGTCGVAKKVRSFFWCL
jgi:hypothetical protein